MIRVWVVARIATILDATCSNIMTFQRPIEGRVNNDVFNGSIRWILEASHYLWICRITRIQDEGAGVRALRAEAIFRPRCPVAESPLSNISKTVMDPDIGIEATPAKIIMADNLDVEGLSSIGTAAICMGRCRECQSEQGNYAQQKSNVTSKFHRSSFHNQ